MTPKPLRLLAVLLGLLAPGPALVAPVTSRVDNGRPFLQHGGAGLLPLAAPEP